MTHGITCPLGVGTKSGRGHIGASPPGGYPGSAPRLPLTARDRELLDQERDLNYQAPLAKEEIYRLQTAILPLTARERELLDQERELDYQGPLAKEENIYRLQTAMRHQLRKHQNRGMHIFVAVSSATTTLVPKRAALTQRGTAMFPRIPAEPVT
ncbi:hypothetical protein HPB47_006514 [Ixodes persulcatus]|uniref:Uncharacterized protein n=1 Tax=Ixodes persulcatus TaxID=34615 RepID=A0AC60PAZ3_IXOPE|nr:hypothetical protein HPB47_006514 [Ixodes persulcatus]